MEGLQISGSPFPVSARLSVEKLKTPILTIHEGIPMAIAVNHQKGEVLVTMEDKYGVTVFNSNGERLRFFDTCGSGEGYPTPNGVAVDGEENVFIGDRVHHCIKKFTAQGEFVREVNMIEDDEISKFYPCGVAYNASNGRVYAVSASQVKIFTSDLNIHGAFGKRGAREGQFNSPEHVACDNTRNVYVADSGNHRIQVFTAEGDFLRMFGKYGKGFGELDSPQGVAIDADSRVYVSEYGNCRVSVFTLEGQFVTSFGSQGNRPGQFEYPHGLAVDSIGVVYVCDELTGVQLF